MQLKQQTDYAIRTLLYLAQRRQVHPAREVATALCIAESYLPKVMRQLRQKGWVASDTGTSGGYSLRVDPRQITLLAVIELMESRIKINRCLEPDGYCSRNATATCPVHFIYTDCQSFLEWYLSSVTIADLVKPQATVAVRTKLAENFQSYIAAETAPLSERLCHRKNTCLILGTKGADSI